VQLKLWCLREKYITWQHWTTGRSDILQIIQMSCPTLDEFIYQLFSCAVECRFWNTLTVYHAARFNVRFHNTITLIYGSSSKMAQVMMAAVSLVPLTSCTIFYLCFCILLYMYMLHCWRSSGHMIFIVISTLYVHMTIKPLNLEFWICADVMFLWREWFNLTRRKLYPGTRSLLKIVAVRSNYLQFWPC